MKRRVLAGFLLGILFVMNALGISSARAILVSGQEVNKNELEVTRETVKYPQKAKETFDGINEAAHMRKLGLGGKKVMAHKGSSVDLQSEKGAEGGASKISAEENDSLRKSLRSSRERMNDQKKHMTILEPKASKFANFVIPRSSASNTNTKCSQDSNASLKSSSSPERKIYEEPHDSNEKDESQSLLEAAKEIVNLMHKDYKGMGRRKPPINNNQPRN